MTITVTNHAVERYSQRVEPVGPEIARERLSSPTIQLASEIGCGSVKLGSGHRVLIKNGSVLTVYKPQNAWKGMRE